MNVSCDCDWCDGNQSGYAVALDDVESAINARVERIGKEAAGIETALEIIEELRASE